MNGKINSIAITFFICTLMKKSITKDKSSIADILRHQASENLLPIINQLNLAEKHQGIQFLV